MHFSAILRLVFDTSSIRSQSGPDAGGKYLHPGTERDKMSAQENLDICSRKYDSFRNKYTVLQEVLFEKLVDIRVVDETG